MDDLLQALMASGGGNDIQALQARLQGLQQPQSTPVDVFRMQQEALMNANRAGRMRTPVSGAGPLGAVVNYLGRKRGNESEQAALDQLVKAMEAQSGIGQYEKQVSDIQAQIQEQMKRQQEMQDFFVKEGYKENIKSPDKVKIAQWALSQPPEVQQQLKDLGILGGPSTTVNVGDKPDWTVERNKLVMGDNQSLYQLGADAQRAMIDYDMGLALLDKVETGKFSEMKNEARKALNALGADFDPNEIANFEQLAPIFGEQTMARIQQTKGAVSNKEMDMFSRMNANYEYSTEGNRRLLQFGKAKAERDVKIRALISDLRRQNKSPMKIAEAVDQFVNENDLSYMLEAFIGGSGVKSPAEMSDEELLENL